MTTIIFNFVFSFLASLCFGVMFNIRGNNLFFAALGGSFGWLVYALLSPILSEDIVRYFIASVLISVYSQKMAIWRKTPVLVFLAVAFIPLVPGYSIYKTMECVLLSDTDFMNYALYTFKVVMAMATGFLVSSYTIHTTRR